VIVATSFIGPERIQVLTTLAEAQERVPGISLETPLAMTGDRGLIVGIRRPRPWDWVNGVFVGDHAEPEDDDPAPHVHGEPR
jgi:hypothetical protein